jgi:hypothetical protein
MVILSKATGLSFRDAAKKQGLRFAQDDKSGMNLSNEAKIWQKKRPRTMQK